MRAGFMLCILAGTAVLGASAMGPAASAGMTATQECVSWQSQFDKEIRTHANKAKAPVAKQLRDQGVAECKAGNVSDGATKLQQALNDIGIKPAN